MSAAADCEIEVLTGRIGDQQFGNLRGQDRNVKRFSGGMAGFGRGQGTGLSSIREWVAQGSLNSRDNTRIALTFERKLLNCVRQP